MGNSIPNGLQEHGLWKMDGRTWIEPMFPPLNETSARMRKKSIEKGWLTPLKRESVASFIINESR